MKKGLSILLEQQRPSVGVGRTPAPVTPAPVTPDPVTPDPVTTDAVINKDDAMRNRLLVMFDEFKIFDENDTEMVKSLRTDETSKNYIVDTAIRKGKVKPADELDDIFVQVLVKYLIDNNKNKKKLPFRIEYPQEYEITLFENAVKGLAKILFEQSYVGTKTMYINYAKNGKNFGFTNDKNAASSSYNILTHEQSRNQGDNATAKKTTEVKPEVKPEVPTPPPPPPKPAEDELNIAPKIEMIQKKAEQSGVESIMKNLNPEQQRVLKNYTNQDWSTLKPANQDMDMYDVINLKDDETSFKDFKTFPLYRPKRMTENNLNAYAGLLDSQNVERQMCKATAKIYYDGAKARKRLSDNAKKQMADYLTACNYQIKNYMDLGKTKEYFAAFENDLDEVPSFIINYSARTVGGNKF